MRKINIDVQFKDSKITIETDSEKMQKLCRMLESKKIDNFELKNHLLKYALKMNYNRKEAEIISKKLFEYINKYRHIPGDDLLKEIFSIDK